MRDQAFELQQILRSSPTARDIGQLVHRGWLLKRGLASSVSNDQIDDWYERAMAGGACGGKIAGAGNGGFLLIVAEQAHRATVRTALSELTEVSVRPEVHGSQILLPLTD